MSIATDKQMDFVLGLMGKIKRRDDSDLRFYEIVQKIAGRRSVMDLTIQQASQVIAALKVELDLK